MTQKQILRWAVLTAALASVGFGLYRQEAPV